MKIKKYLIFLLIILLPFLVSAQSTTVQSFKSPLAILHGGTNAASFTTGYLPYFDATRLVASPVYTNATNVGIGTTSMTYRLGVDGVVSATDFRGTIGATTRNTGDFSTVTITNPLSVLYGGTGLQTAALNGIFYGNGTSAFGVTAIGTEGQMLRVGASPFVPAWSTATYPNTTTAYQLLVNTATNVVGGLTVGTTGQILRGATGAVPTWTTTTYPVTNTAYSLAVATGTNVMGELAVGTTGQYLSGVTGAVPAWATLNQAAISGLTTASSPVFVTAKLSGLTDGYIPKHTSDAAGLENSVIYTDGTNVGINNTSLGERLVVAGNIKTLGTAGGLTRKVAEATCTTTAATTCVITLNIPTQARLLGAQLRVDTALTAGETWGAAYSGGSTTTIAAAGTAVAKSTKVSKMHVDEVTTTTTNITVTRDAGSFTAGGVIRGIVYYDDFAVMADAP